MAAVIVEPVQAEGGDRHASPAFFRGLQSICAEEGATFIVDEVQTGGGATGRLWAHEAWDLDAPPDIVTFSKKFQAAGIFTTDKYRPDVGYRLFNTWMGDPTRLLQLEAIMNTVKEQGLLENATAAGDYMKEGLRLLEVRCNRCRALRCAAVFGWLVFVRVRRCYRCCRSFAYAGWFPCIMRLTPVPPPSLTAVPHTQHERRRPPMRARWPTCAAWAPSSPSTARLRPSETPS